MTSFYSNSSSSFTRHHAEEVAMAFSSIDCVLCREKGIYASTELTSGIRLYDALREHGCATAAELKTKLGEEWFQKNIWDVNVEMALTFAKSIRDDRTPHSMVITPAPFMAPGWNQQEYLAFWETLIRTRVRAAWFNDNWQFSNGCTFEFAVAQDANVPTCDAQGRLLSLPAGIELVRDAIRSLELRKLDVRKLRDNLNLLLARVVVEEESSAS